VQEGEGKGGKRQKKSPVKGGGGLAELKRGGRPRE